MSFTDLNLSEPILKVLNKAGYHTPTPIQEKTIPLILNRQDVLGCAQTGTGKTAAFSLPIIELLLQGKLPLDSRNSTVQALILSPTRELAIQIGENIATYTGETRIKHAVVFGGVSTQNQIREIQQKRPQILVATTGRLLDLIQQGAVSIKHVHFFVLDEADRMLDMGFINDIKKVVKMIPEKRQTLLFSATMPIAIEQLANSILTAPVRVDATPVSSTAETITQAIYPVAKVDKIKLLTHLIHENSLENVLVFNRTKHGADKIVRKLRSSQISAEAIHGNKSQQARQNALKNFKSGKIKVLVATDIAARGIDIDQLKLVINYDLPNEPESYVHRIGRTGRAGASGQAWSFCDMDEREYLWQINKLINQTLPIIDKHPYMLGDVKLFEKPLLTHKSVNKKGIFKKKFKGK